jgi:hypothetical protein
MVFALVGVASPSFALDRSALDLELQKSQIFAAMKRLLPDQYDQVVTIVLENASSPERVRYISRHFTAQLLADNAVMVGAAPNEQTSHVLSVSVDLIRAVRTGVGKKACAKWNAGDPKLAQVISERFTKAFATRMVAAFEAIAGAVQDPVQRADPTPADWQELVAYAARNGFSKEKLQQLGRADGNDEQECALFEQFLGNAIGLPGPAGDRIRASLAVSIVAKSASPPQ